MKRFILVMAIMLAAITAAMAQFNSGGHSSDTSTEDFNNPSSIFSLH